MNISYANSVPPAEYKCGSCGAHGLKLWREYQTTSPRLLCGKCAMADQKKTGTIDVEGYRMSDSGRTRGPGRGGARLLGLHVGAGCRGRMVACASDDAEDAPSRVGAHRVQHIPPFRTT